MMAVPYVIAEIANSHNGDYETLLSLIKASAESGAHGVKFQWFSPDTLAMPDFEWYPVYKKLMFSEDQWDEAIKLANDLNLDVWADATDTSSIQRIERNVSRIFGLKLPPSTILETEHAKNVLAIGKLTLIGVGGHEDAVIDKCLTTFKSINSNLIIQHGFQGYPTKQEDATLARISFLKAKHGLPVAYADHEEGGSALAMDIPKYAFFAGASFIEKHICLDRTTKPYDHYSALNPSEFSDFMKVMEVCKAIYGDIRITEAQKKYLTVSSRGILKSSKKQGEIVLPEDIVYRRTPVTEALTTDLMEQAIPAYAKLDMKAGHPIKAEDLATLKIIAVVPCRLNSTRLKSKALLPIAGMPSIQRCLINIKQIRFVTKTVLATSTASEDTPLESLAADVGIETFRGSPDDVLQRIIAIGEQEKADIVLRLTGDCPALSFEMLEYMILDHLKSGADITYCHENVAVGTVGDVYTFSALKRLKSIVPEALYSEYLSYYFINNPEVFNVNHIKLPAIWAKPEWRLTLDESSDLDLLEKIYMHCNIGMEPITFHQISQYLNEYPEAANLNQGNKLKYKADSEFIKKLNEATTLNFNDAPKQFMSGE